MIRGVIKRLRILFIIFDVYGEFVSLGSFNVSPVYDTLCRMTCRWVVNQVGPVFIVSKKNKLATIRIHGKPL